MRRVVFLTAALAVLLLVFTQELRAQGGRQPTRYFCGIGNVVSVDDDKSGVSIAHQTIEGYMPAMTMHFKVTDLEVLGSISAGERVRFVLRDTPELTRMIYIERLAPKLSRRRRH